MAGQRTYCIGGHYITLAYEGDTAELDAMLRSFRPFRRETVEGAAVLFHLEIAKRLKEVPQEHRRLIRDVDTGNGMTQVDKLDDGGYQFLIRDIRGNSCALMIASHDFKQCTCALRGSASTKQFAINNVLMLAYAFSAARHDTLLIHASVIRHAGKAYAFTAKSGTGKSTQVANWMRAIEGCDIINDDNPIIRIIDGKPMLFGSPWSGKTPCYRDVSAPLGAVIAIERAQQNSVAPMRPIAAFSVMLSACSSMKWDEALYQDICSTVARFVEGTKVVTLHCLPDEASALTCREYLEA